MESYSIWFRVCLFRHRSECAAEEGNENILNFRASEFFSAGQTLGILGNSIS